MMFNNLFMKLITVMVEDGQTSQEVNANGKAPGETVGNPFGILGVYIITNDPAWTGKASSVSAIVMNGPPGETYSGNILVLKPQSPPIV